MKFQKGHKINLGKKCSEENKIKKSIANKGQIPWIKGRKHSEETRKKISDGNLGHIVSKETRQKISNSHKGEKCWNWRGGKTPLNKCIRRSGEYTLWRKVIFERDNFTCQKYKIRRGKLHPHHINNFADFPELRFAIDNGITLSEKAHKEFHQIYGNRNNTKEQLLEFLNKDKR